MPVKRELTIPPDALIHPAVEIIRVWLANQQQHVSLNIGFWEERGIDERTILGIALADMMHHIVNAHESKYGRDREESLRLIRSAFDVEMAHPTSERLGSFIEDRSEGV